MQFMHTNLFLRTRAPPAFVQPHRREVHLPPLLQEDLVAHGARDPPQELSHIGQGHVDHSLGPD